jgi:hypothetical protein
VYLVESDWGSNELVTLDGPSLRPSRVALDGLLSLSGVADINGDGRLQALGTRAATPVLVDIDTGETTWEGSGLSASWLRAGPLDDGAALAIVLGNPGGSGQVGTVLDGATLQPRWTWPGPFAGDIHFGRFTHPASRQFAVVTRSGYATIFTATPFYSPVHELPAPTVQASMAIDIDGDGLDEIVIGQNQWGRVRVLSGIDGSLKWELQHPGHGIAAIDVGAVGPDGRLAVAHTSGAFANRPSSLRIGTFDGGQVESLSGDQHGPHSSVLLADLDGDGRAELIRGTVDTAPGRIGRRLVVLDPATGRELRGATVDPTFEPATPDGAVMAAGQFDADAQAEIVLAYADLGWRPLRVIDGLTLETQWERYFQPAVVAVAAHDVDGDGTDDVIALVGRTLMFLDGRDGSDIWASAPLDAGVGTHRTLLVDSGAGSPRVMLTIGDHLHVIDIATRSIEPPVAVDIQYPGGSTGPVDVLGQSMAAGAGGGCVHILHSEFVTGSRPCNGGAITGRVHPIRATFARTMPGESAGSGPLPGPLLLSDGRGLWIDVPGEPLRLLREGLGPGLGWANRGALTVHGGRAQLFIGDEVGLYHLRFNPRAFFDSGFEGH